MNTHYLKTRTAGLGAAFGALIVLLALSLTAEAASSNWVETEGGRIRVSALEPAADGTIKAALDIELLPGWKTYWRDPGEAGVPPSFRVDRSSNVQSAEIHFPAPERIEDAYSIWAGYDYPVVLPITLKQETPGTTSVLEADIFLGICESVCIPLQTSFTLTLDPDEPANAFEKRMVARAFRSLPEVPGDDFKVHETVDSGDTLTLAVALPEDADGGEIFVTGPPGWRFETPRSKGVSGNTATFEVPHSGPNEAGLSGETIHVVVKSAGRAMTTDIVID
ncbi:protein-disulfide reductase DsbD domain-containing protein [Hoeflea prorocentri]|uniref:Protein-disulfide reductase DsbD family protein n=1 Tax=Hoeflea prorocentri TaxID=1922333 RepID=A0A9X3UIV9_9HYPH|nr:protein-disulfide reductase DsbD domain-containing protein [Hoeflea prorocentri]MCY6381653.1 protein-disulfide reductase DsbD family protein [Hoeflea prorocentri]MDA5399453.1 protein-disulfide reductase DsbD family protein [Hoeflea prorocentri]